MNRCRTGRKAVVSNWRRRAARDGWWGVDADATDDRRGAGDCLCADSPVWGITPLIPWRSPDLGPPSSGGPRCQLYRTEVQISVSTSRLEESYDVVVVGGGSGGVGAAVGAAQSGAKVCLIERYPFLGGAATASSVLSYCGFFDQRRERMVGGVGEDLLTQLRDRGAYREITLKWSGTR